MSEKTETDLKKDEFDVELEASKKNGLTNNSLIKIRQLRCISKKRLKTNRKGEEVRILGEIEEKYHDKIETKVKTMLAI